MGKTRLLAVALMLLPLLALAAESPDPQMKTIIDNAIQRDKLFDRVDAKYNYTYIEGYGKSIDFDAPGRVVKDGAKVFVYNPSGRWVKDGAKVFVDYVYKDMDGESSIHYASAFDGKAIRHIDYTSRSGGIAPASGIGGNDLGGDVYLAIGSLGIRYDGERVCDLLQGEVSPAGNETLDGKDCAVVDVFRETNSAWGGKLRFYFAKDFGYAPAKIDDYVSSDTKTPEPTLTLSGFKQAPEGTWYATESRTDGLTDWMWPRVKCCSVIKIEEITFPSSIDPALFTPKFPAGTEVDDDVVHIDYVVGAPPSAAVNMETLTLSPAGDSDAGAPQTKDAAPPASGDPGRAAAPFDSPAPRPGILTTVLTIVAIALVFVLVVHRFRQSRPNS